MQKDEKTQAILLRQLLPALAIKTSIYPMAQAEIELSEYSSEWPLMFQLEKKRLFGLIGQFNHGGIEHVGSTAVDGLIAKPVIDIMFGENLHGHTL